MADKTQKELKVVGRAERIHFPEADIYTIPARIDTGARLSAVWASRITEKDGELSFCLFGEGSELYTGRVLKTKTYETVAIASSNGHIERRYKVKLLVRLKGKRIRASFTLANRETQAFPVLIGRNILLGKFLVDSKKAHKELKTLEKRRTKDLQSQLENLI